MKMKRFMSILLCALLIGSAFPIGVYGAEDAAADIEAVESAEDAAAEMKSAEAVEEDEQEEASEKAAEAAPDTDTEKAAETAVETEPQTVDEPASEIEDEIAMTSGVGNTEELPSENEPQSSDDAAQEEAGSVTPESEEVKQDPAGSEKKLQTPAAGDKELLTEQAEDPAKRGTSDPAKGSGDGEPASGEEEAEDPFKNLSINFIPHEIIEAYDELMCCDITIDHPGDSDSYSIMVETDSAVINDSIADVVTNGRTECFRFTGNANWSMSGSSECRFSIYPRTDLAPGEYSTDVRITITSAEGDSFVKTETITFEVIPALTFIQVSPAAEDFGIVTEGYSEMTARSIKIRNWLPYDLVIPKSVSDNYIVTGFEEQTVLEESTGSLTISVAPKPGLPIGNYDEDLEITFLDATGQRSFGTKTLSLKFTVYPNVYDDISISPSTVDFGSKPYGYGEIDSQNFTVINASSADITVVRPEALNYTIESPQERTQVTAGSGAAFTVSPNPGLPAGDYNEEVSVHMIDPGGNEFVRNVSLNFSVSHTINADQIGFKLREGYKYGDIHFRAYESLSSDGVEESFTVENHNTQSLTISGYSIDEKYKDYLLIEQISPDARLSGNGGTAVFKVKPAPNPPVTRREVQIPVSFSFEGDDGDKLTKSMTVWMEVRPRWDEEITITPDVYDFGTVDARSNLTMSSTKTIAITTSLNNYTVIRPESEYFDVDKFLLHEGSEDGRVIVGYDGNATLTNGYPLTFLVSPAGLRPPGTYEEDLELCFVDTFNNVDITVYRKTIKLKYTVKPDDNYHFYKCTTHGRGSVKPEWGYAREGDSVIVNAIPDDGYEVLRWEVKSGDTFTIGVDDRDDLQKRGFIMGGSDVELEIFFSMPELTLKAVTIVESEGGSGTADPPLLDFIGKDITITAQPKGGYVFDYWEVIAGDVILDDPHSATTTFISNGNAVTLKPHFIELTVTLKLIQVLESEGGSGEASPPAGMYPGRTITLTAKPRGDYIFDHWEVVAGDVTLENPYSTVTTFTFPGWSVTVKPVFVEKEVVLYPVNILKTEGGSGTADPPTTNIVGQTITITAKSYASHRFDHWEVLAGGITLENPNSAVTTFTAPGIPVTLKPCFEPYTLISFHTTTIQYTDDGTSGTATADPEVILGTGTVNLSAAANEGYYFKEWKVLSGGVQLKDAKNAATSFTMGYESVIVQPVFEPVTVTGIALDASKAKTEYEEGDELDVSGLILTAEKTDGGTETVPATADMVSGFDSSQTGPQTLTVTYQGFTAEYEIEVKSKSGPDDPDDPDDPDNPDAPPVSGYTVSFDANVPANASTTCTGSMDDQTFAADEEKALSTNGYSLPGYDFTGWNTKADGAGSSYSDKESVGNLSDDGSTVTLYAQWKPKEYRIIFHPGEIGGDDHVQTAYFDQQGTLETYSDDDFGWGSGGRTLRGWAGTGFETFYSDGASFINLCGEPRQGGSLADVNLFAQWVENGQIIVTVVKDSVPQEGLADYFKLVNKDGIEFSVPLTYGAGKYTFDTSQATHQGHGPEPLPEGEYDVIFGYTEYGTPRYRKTSAIITYEADSASNVVFNYYTFAVKRDPAYVSLYYSLEGDFGIEPSGALVALDGSTVTMRYTYLDPNYIFDRYTVDGVAPIWEDGDLTKPEQTFRIRGKTTIIAHLVPRPSLTITPKPQKYTYNGQIQGEGDTVYEDPAEIAEKVSVEGLRDGDSVASIILDGQGDSVGDYEQLIASNVKVVNAAGNDVTGNYDINYQPGTLTIDPAEVTITVNSVSKMEGDIDPAFTGTVEGLFDEGDLGEIEFVRAGSDEAAGTYKGVLTATYTENPNYKVTVVPGDFTIKAILTLRWLDGDGSLLQEKTYVEGETAPAYEGIEPTKAETEQYTYAFSDWDGGTTEGTVTTYKPLFKETPKQYSVAFVDYDGKTVLKEVVSYDYGTAAADIVLPDDPVRKADAQYSYTFTGWTPELTEVTADAVYTAVYESDKQKYTVTWLQDDGTQIDQTIVEYGENPVHADPVKAADAQYTYTFDGWDPEVTKVTGEAIYKATYTATPVPVKKGTLTFDLAGGTLDGKTGKITIEANVGDTIKLPSAPTREGYTFQYWKGSMYEAGADYKVEGDHTFTAVWKENEKEPDPVKTYTVTFNANGHGTAPASQTVEDGKKAAKPADPTASGYTFGGWFTDKECKSAYSFDTAVTKDITLYAKWTKNSSSSGGDNDYSSTSDKAAVNTGDESHVGLWFMLLTTSLLILLLVAKKRKGVRK